MAVVVMRLLLLLLPEEHSLVQLGSILAGAGGLLFPEGGGCLSLGLLGALIVGALAALNLLARVLLLFGFLLQLKLAARGAEALGPRGRVEIRLGPQPREPPVEVE